MFYKPKTIWISEIVSDIVAQLRCFINKKNTFKISGTASEIMANLGFFYKQKTFYVFEIVISLINWIVARKKYANFCEDSRSKIKLKLKIDNVFLKFMKLLCLGKQSSVVTKSPFYGVGGGRS